MTSVGPPQTRLAIYLLTRAAVIPYRELAKDKNEGDMSGTMASTLPMAAVSTCSSSIAVVQAYWLL